MKAIEKPKQIKLSQMLAPYEGMWVALNNTEDKVIASGSTLDSVLKKANDQGEKTPVVIKAPDKNSIYFL